jgi:hypothetical protein
VFALSTTDTEGLPGSYTGGMTPSRRASPIGDPERMERTRLGSALEDPGPAVIFVVTAGAASARGMLAAPWVTADPRPSATLHLAAYIDDAISPASGLINVLKGHCPPAQETWAFVTLLEPGFSGMYVAADSMRGRDDPCSCGGGRRSKKHHGALMPPSKLYYSRSSSPRSAGTTSRESDTHVQ